MSDMAHIGDGFRSRMEILFLDDIFPFQPRRFEDGVIFIRQLEMSDQT